MNANIKKIFLLAFVLYQCEATVSSIGDVTNGKDSIADPISRPIREIGVTRDTVRHLDHEKMSIHTREESPYFNVRVPYALLSCLIIHFFTFAGLLIVIPCLMNARKNIFKSAFWVADSHLQNSTNPINHYSYIDDSTERKNADQNVEEKIPTDISIPSIVCGVIMASTLFLIIPESILQIQRGSSSLETGEIEILSGTISRFGAALMFGFVLDLTLTAMFPRSLENIPDEENVPSSDLKYTSKEITDEEKTEEDNDCTVNEQELKECNDNKSINSANDDNIIDEDSDDTINKKCCLPRLLASIFVSDATHDIFDGMFIGVAFMTCSTATAVCISIITFYNELSRKTASYFLLTECSGVSTSRALLFVFFSSLALILGVSLIIACTIHVGELTIGGFLAIASGVYFHISATQCLARINSVVSVPKDRLFTIFFFVCGALPIGFTLFSHGHCDV